MKISKVELPFLSCQSSTLIECSGVDKSTAEGIALLLGYEVQDFYDDLDFVDVEIMGSWRDENSDLSLFIDEGSEAETRYISLGGEGWIKKLLTGRTNPV